MGLFTVFTKEKELETGERVKVIDPPKYIGFGTLAGVVALVVWMTLVTRATALDVFISFMAGVGLFALWGWIAWLANRKPLQAEPGPYSWEREQRAANPPPDDENVDLR